MTHKEKIKWMQDWCNKQKVVLELEGECGFCRECVGILTTAGCFPDYHWYDKNYNRIDNNGNIWIPDDAYHKHECVAVLGRRTKAENQLYEWLKWFDGNGFVVEVKANDNLSQSDVFLGNYMSSRMVKKCTK